jgi:hypothetical protein
MGHPMGYDLDSSTNLEALQIYFANVGMIEKRLKR